jgi:hypothetical protein
MRSQLIRQHSAIIRVRSEHERLLSPELAITIILDTKAGHSVVERCCSHPFELIRRIWMLALLTLLASVYKKKSLRIVLTALHLSAIVVTCSMQ